MRLILCALCSFCFCFFVSSSSVNLVTASQVLTFLHDNSDLLGAIGSKPLSHCKGLIRTVLLVTEDSTAIDGRT